MEERLKSVIERVVPGIDLAGVTSETRLVEDLGFDSLALMMMAMGIEDAFGYRFTEFVRFATVGEVCDYLQDKI
jgi:acyl carrier protein